MKLKQLLEVNCQGSNYVIGFTIHEANVVFWKGTQEKNSQKEQNQCFRMRSLKIQDMLMENNLMNLKKLWMVN